MQGFTERLAQQKIGFYCFDTFPFDQYNFYKVNGIWNLESLLI